MLAVGPPVHAQLIAIDLRGKISLATEPEFAIGGSVQTSWRLPTPLVNVSPFGPDVYVYESTSNIVRFGKTVFPVVSPMPYVGRRGVDVQPNGFIAHYDDYFFEAFGSLIITMASGTRRVTGPDGVILPHLPLSDFDAHYGRIYASDGRFLAQWDITSYSVTRVSAVPEPGAYVIASTIVLLGAVVGRQVTRARRRRAAE